MLHTNSHAVVPASLLGARAAAVVVVLATQLQLRCRTPHPPCLLASSPPRPLFLCLFAAFRFEMLDRDGTGSLDKEELVAALRSVNKNLISPRELECKYQSHGWC